MNSMPLTVMDIFSSGVNLLSADRLSKMESCEKLCQLKNRISRKFIGIPWASALSMISKKALEIFDLSIPEVLVRAWNKYQMLLEYADKEKYPPGTKKDVELVSHTVKSVHHPRLEIIVNEVKAHEVKFEIDLSLIVHGLILTVQDAKVKEIVAGSCKVELTVRCEECLILQNETRTFKFLEPMSLGDGIPIRPLSSD